MSHNTGRSAGGELTRPDGTDALPRRFRDYIAALERELRELRSSVGAQAVTRAWTQPVSNDEARRYIDPFDGVMFRINEKLPDHEQLHVRAERAAGARGPFTRVQVSVGWSGLVVYPQVSNVVLIGSKD